MPSDRVRKPLLLTLLWLIACPPLFAQQQFDRATAIQYTNRTIPTITGATPSVALGNVFITGNGSPTTITNFLSTLGLVRIIVICGETNTTFANNANIVMTGGANLLCTSNLTIEFQLDGSGIWHQVGGTGNGGNGTPGGASLSFQYNCSGAFCGVNVPTAPNGVFQFFGSTPSGGVGQVGSFAFGGVLVDASNPATLLVTHRSNEIIFSGTTNAFSLPATSGTGFGNNFAFLTPNFGSGNLTTTATSPNTIDGGAAGGSNTTFPGWTRTWYQDGSGNWHTVYYPMFTAFNGGVACTTALNFSLSTGIGCNASAGTVTSVGLQVNSAGSSGIFTITGSPVNSAGNLNFNISATSGGVICATSSTVLASSAALTANLPVIGGGAGVCPSVGTVTGNTTKFVTGSGSYTTGDFVDVDANGNVVDTGQAYGNSINVNGQTCVIAGVGCNTTQPWNSNTNPTGNLSLTMGANLSTFTYNAATGAGVNLWVQTDTTNNTGTGFLHQIGTAVGSAASGLQLFATGSSGGVLTQALALDITNPTAATVSQCQPSPIFQIGGRTWAGAGADTKDFYGLQETCANGLNGATTLNFTHTGSTANPIFAFPSTSTFTMNGATINSSSAAFNINGNGTSNISINSSGAVSINATSAQPVTVSNVGLGVFQINMSSSAADKGMLIKYGNASPTGVALELQSSTAVHLFDLTTPGIFSLYNSIASVGNGMAEETGKANIAASSSTVGATNVLASTPAAGFYRISYYLRQKASGSGGTCSTNATVTVTLAWTDDGFGAQTKVETALNLTPTLAAGAYQVDTIPLIAANATAITHATTFVNGNCTTQPTYSLDTWVQGPF